MTYLAHEALIAANLLGQHLVLVTITLHHLQAQRACVRRVWPVCLATSAMTSTCFFMCRQCGVTLRTTCCQMFLNFRRDSGFSRYSTAPSSILFMTSVALPPSDISTKGRSFKAVTNAGLSSATDLACSRLVRLQRVYVSSRSLLTT